MHSAIGDIDGDGKPDVAHSNYFYSGGAILRNSTAGPITFEAAKRINIGGRAQLHSQT
jgi:hypothetical protein